MSQFWLGYTAAFGTIIGPVLILGAGIWAREILRAIKNPAPRGEVRGPSLRGSPTPLDLAGRRDQAA